MISRMDIAIRYRGRTITCEDITFMKSLIAEHPHDSRRALSVRLCEAWGWAQANGSPRDMVCRGLMLELDRSGLIELPAKRRFPPNPLGAERARPTAPEVDRTPIDASLKGLGALEIRRVGRTSEEALYNGLIEHYHYLGYCHPVGEQLKYVVFAGERPIACIAYSSAPRHIGCRDRFIGWSPQGRRENLHLIAYNTRFLILPWVRVRNLASHLLSRTARRVAEDWSVVYGHPVLLLTTFIDTERFRGTCYQAAGWIRLGTTTGRGKNDQTGKANR
ncbi:DUF4338 domain-containing protein, partial [Candidatus Bipolaricaulota bacterium]|nr:DUF4338 domain-containing protein [Candidatus Bipolaricaulota bacterium]